MTSLSYRDLSPQRKNREQKSDIKFIEEHTDKDQAARWYFKEVEVDRGRVRRCAPVPAWSRPRTESDGNSLE